MTAMMEGNSLTPPAKSRGREPAGVPNDVQRLPADRPAYQPLPSHAVCPDRPPPDNRFRLYPKRPSDGSPSPGASSHRSRPDRYAAWLGFLAQDGADCPVNRPPACRRERTRRPRCGPGNEPPPAAPLRRPCNSQRHPPCCPSLEAAG